jgi:UDP-N-acetylglucosamine 1-carboxyvinyltransferase
MAKFLIKGPARLKGRVRISGAKNSALKIMAASIMAKGVTVLENVPEIDDVYTMIDVLKKLGADVAFEGNVLTINPKDINSFEAPYELVRKMRASILVAGPLLSRFGQVKIAIPGGCNIGSRQIDLHLKGFEVMGATSKTEHGYVYLKASARLLKKKLQGARIDLDFPSRGATENIIMSATLAEGTTVINNAAREPEIIDLAGYLNQCGAQIEGAGSHSIKISGVDHLKGTRYRVMPDSIEAGTFIGAAALCAREVVIEDAIYDNIGIFCDKLLEIGIGITKIDERSIRVTRPRSAMKPAFISTLPYPGFPTDLQPIISVILSLADGNSIVTENVFENRFMYVDELNRMGANIRIDGHHAVITGVEKLSGAPVTAFDLRAGAALVIAGLAASGKTEVNDAYHIQRGYEAFDQKLQNLGADIRLYKDN